MEHYACICVEDALDKASQHPDDFVVLHLMKHNRVVFVRLASVYWANKSTGVRIQLVLSMLMQSRAVTEW